MKALLAAVTAAALIAPLAASAQDRGGREYYQRGGERPAAARAPDAAPRGDRSGARTRDFGARRAQEAPAAQAPPAAPSAPRAAQARNRTRFEGDRQRGQRAQDRRDDRAPSFAQSSPRFDRRDGARSDNRSRSDNRFQGANRFDNNRYDNNRYDNRRNQWRSDRRFFDNRNTFRRIRAAPFRWPSGYSATRWTIRQRLPSIFLTRTYFIDNFYGMGLPYPPPGAEWIRVGADALLVDIFTGEILDVAYDAFYW